jgi:hypothetical protein
MASIPVTIVGVAYTDKTGNPPITLTIVAEMYTTGLGVGGGPMPGGQPPGIWGGAPPYVDTGLPGPQPGQPPRIWGGPFQPPIASQGPGFPTNPIVLPPVTPGGPPVVIWGGPPNYIDIGGPGPQPIPPAPPEGAKPPPEGGGWGYSPDYGWGYFPMGSGAGPKA